MYSRVFVIKLLTGVVKANAKRVEVAQVPVLVLRQSPVPQWGCPDWLDPCCLRQSR